MPISFIDHAPRIFVVGVTTPRPDEIRAYLQYRGEMWNMFEPQETSPPEVLVEMAGRVCYHSWNNPKKSANKEYIQNSIVSSGHHSVLEHVWVNLLVADVCRSTEMEIIRHGEGTAFSWESQRFTDKHLRFIVPPNIRYDEKRRSLFEYACEAQASVYHELMNDLKNDVALAVGATATELRKRTKEAARSVLGNAVGADGMVSMNLRAARHMIQLRTDASADQSIRETFYEIYENIRPLFPATFDDSAFFGGPGNVPQIKFSTEP